MNMSVTTEKRVEVREGTFLTSDTSFDKQSSLKVHLVELLWLF